MWYELKIDDCPSNTIEALSEALEESGAVSITYTDKQDNPVLEPEPGTTPLWPEVILTALYPSDLEAQQAQKNLLMKYPFLKMACLKLEEKNWERAWMDDFKPLCFGDRLWVCPSWTAPPNPDAVNLILDPGLAFGTGTHATTSLCLRWLDKANIQQKTVIDYGTGSGILALAALKLGAKKVYAVDIDDQALLATKNNAVTNQIADNQLVIDYPQHLNEPVDLMIANILLAPLIDLKTTFFQLLKENARLVVSGILEEQASTLIEAYQELFIINSTDQLEGWMLLEFTRI